MTTSNIIPRNHIPYHHQDNYNLRSNWYRWTVGRLESLGKLILIPGALVVISVKAALTTAAAALTGNQLHKSEGNGHVWTFEGTGRELGKLARLTSDIFVKVLGGVVLAPSKEDKNLIGYAHSLFRLMIDDASLHRKSEDAGFEVSGEGNTVRFIKVTDKEIALKDYLTILFPGQYFKTLLCPSLKTKTQEPPTGKGID